MNGVQEFSLSLAAAFGYALATWPILRARSFGAPLFPFIFGAVVLFAPLLISADQVVARALASVACIELMLKMVDYSRQSRQHIHATTRFRDYVRFLIPFPFMMVVFGQRNRRLPALTIQRDVAVVLVSSVAVLAGFAVTGLLSTNSYVRSSFLLDHSIKVAIFIFTLEAISRVLHSCERLVGFDTTLPMNNTFLSKTVAEFWCRFNTRVHEWMDHNIFIPTGGRRAPARGVWLTFLFSAAFHELGFGIATSRFDGYQFVFFIVQPPAVLISRGLHRFAMRRGDVARAGMRCLTIIWMVVTSMFFFHGVDRVFPFFYASRPWLR